jgi:hypothetical protein
MNKTMKTKQQQIEEAIRAVCPETMELKFGCWIRNKNTGDENLVINGDVFGGKILHWNFNINEARILEPDNIKILGTPLDLSHLLRAIPLTCRIVNTGYIVATGFPNDVSCKYDLEKTLAENLEDPVLCEFLYQILIVEK